MKHKSFMPSKLSTSLRRLESEQSIFSLYEIVIKKYYNLYIAYVWHTRVYRMNEQ